MSPSAVSLHIERLTQYRLKHPLHPRASNGEPRLGHPHTLKIPFRGQRLDVSTGSTTTRATAPAWTTSRRLNGRAYGLAQNLRDGLHIKRLRQQTLKQPIQASTLPMVVSTAPASPPREAQTPTAAHVAKHPRRETDFRLAPSYVDVGSVHPTKLGQNLEI